MLSGAKHFAALRRSRWISDEKGTASASAVTPDNGSVCCSADLAFKSAACPMIPAWSLRSYKTTLRCPIPIVGWPYMPVFGMYAILPSLLEL